MPLALIQTQGDLVTATHGWAPYLALGLPGVLLASLALYLLITRKKYRLGILLLIMGGVFLAVTTTVLPFEKATFNQQQLTVRTGYLGIGYQHTLDLTELQRVEIAPPTSASTPTVHTARMSRGSRRRNRHRSGRAAWLECYYLDGRMDRMKMNSGLLDELLPQLIASLRKQGVEVIDHR